MIDSVKPISFKNGNGEILHGMLHYERNHLKDIGIIILSPGIKSRVAPHRLYVKMSSFFNKCNLTTLRFDPAGLGDSEGEIDAEFSADVYGSIQVGRYINDTVAAIDWMQNHCGISKFILAGLCGGAITGLLAGQNDDRVDALISLGIPVILDSSEVDPNMYITSGQLNDMREAYFKKLFDLKSWRRLLTFKTDFRLLFKSLSEPFKSTFSNFGSKINNLNSNDSDEKVPEGTNFNPLFPIAFFEFLSKKNILLIFSESDRLYWEYEEKFVRYYKDQLDGFSHNLELFVISEANHVFSFTSWQIELFDIIKSWINRHYTMVNYK